MESKPAANSASKNNDNEAKVKLCSANTTGSQETSATTEAMPENNDSSRNVAGDSTQGKSDAEAAHTATGEAIVRESNGDIRSSLSSGCFDGGEREMEANERGVPNVKKAAETVESSHDVRIGNSDDDRLGRREGANTETVVDNVASSRSPASPSLAIPRKKRRRLENQTLNVENDDNFIKNDEDDSPMDVSLNQLKRQVLGRDLKVDDKEDGWEEEHDSEIRQIRALMNASNASSSSDHNALKSDNTNDTCKGDEESKDLALGKPNSSPSSLSEKLRKDLMCAICHEVVYPPVALECGHSFCQPCIDWWFDHDDAGRCPTCRRSSYPDRYKHSKGPTMNHSPNLALRACVMAMFGPEIVARLQNRKKLRPKGEDGGAHDAGYQILSQLRDETWHYIAICTDNGNGAKPLNSATTIPVRRSIVLDAEDQRMQLALAVYHKPIKEVGSISNDIDNTRVHSGRFRIEICLLTMEEDEAVDSGFPANILTPEDEFFVCGGHNGSSRFLNSYLDVEMKDENGRLSPLARVSADVNDGRFKYVLDPTESAGNVSTEVIRSLVFGHSETGSQLEIDLAQLQKFAGGGSMLPSDQNRRPIERFRRDYYGSDEDFDNERDEEAENQDEFEEDGFLVGSDESNVEGAFSDAENSSVDENEICIICKDGGELMICDGGDKNPGCGKSFHAGCVNRSAIPDGDWICQDCAKAGGIETGIAGHEFREPEEVLKTKNDGEASQRDASSDMPYDDVDDNSDEEGTFSGEDQNDAKSQRSNEADDDGGSLSHDQIDYEDRVTVNPSGKGNTNNSKRRFVLEDSDSD